MYLIFHLHVATEVYFSPFRSALTSCIYTFNARTQVQEIFGLQNLQTTKAEGIFLFNHCPVKLLCSYSPQYSPCALYIPLLSREREKKQNTAAPTTEKTYPCSSAMLVLQFGCLLRVICYQYPSLDSPDSRKIKSCLQPTNQASLSQLCSIKQMRQADA